MHDERILTEDAMLSALDRIAQDFRDIRGEREILVARIDERVGMLMRGQETMQATLNGLVEDEQSNALAVANLTHRVTATEKTAVDALARVIQLAGRSIGFDTADKSHAGQIATLSEQIRQNAERTLQIVDGLNKLEPIKLDFDRRLEDEHDFRKAVRLARANWHITLIIGIAIALGGYIIPLIVARLFG